VHAKEIGVNQQGVRLVSDCTVTGLDHKTEGGKFQVISPLQGLELADVDRAGTPAALCRPLCVNKDRTPEKTNDLTAFAVRSPFFAGGP